jgi:DNA primase
MNYSLGIYVGEMCKLTYRLAMPVRLLDDTIVGFIGYTDKDDFNENNESFIKYLYPPKYVLKKSKYMYVTRQEFKKAIEEDYICIVDGLFDQKALEACGINAVSLCGSALTGEHKLYLDAIKHKIIIADNDSAGRKLASDIKAVWPTAVEIYQTQTKDIDAFLRIASRMTVLKNTIELMNQEGFILSHQLKI